jgi:ring-1,2-phenylacetyl-CoA epoxidase subunit PaaA
VLTEEELSERLASGKLVESIEHMSEGYLAELKRILLISADTELLGAVMYYPNLVARRVPEKTVGAFLAVIQDELGHAHVDYRMLEELGEDADYLIYGRTATQFKHPYAMDMPYDTFAEVALVGAFMDRAGYVLLSDVFENTSYVPWRRALVKVNKEESFHINFGVRNLRLLAADPDTRAETQRAIDWMFPLTVEWFGLPDELKTHDRQIRYKLKGHSNDELRQQWLSQVVPLVEELGFTVPARLDPGTHRYELDFPFPCAFHDDEKRWDFGDPVSWDDVLARWKRRGPANSRLVEIVQSGRKRLDALRQAA